MNLKPAPIAEIAATLAASPAFDWIPGMLAILPEGHAVQRVTETGAIPPAGAFPADGEPIALAAKELGHCELYPTAVAHHANGRCVCASVGGGRAQAT